jgi:hypothetical protein
MIPMNDLIASQLAGEIHASLERAAQAARMLRAAEDAGHLPERRRRRRLRGRLRP